MIVYWYAKITCVLWRGSELLTFINLTWSSYSNSAIGHIGAVPPPLDVVAPDMPSPTGPTRPFCCLPVCSMSNGLPFNSLLRPPKPLAPSQITWDTVNSFSHGFLRICGPPTAVLQPWGGHVRIIHLVLLRSEATQCNYIHAKYTHRHIKTHIIHTHNLFLVTTIKRAFILALLTGGLAPWVVSS